MNFFEREAALLSDADRALTETGYLATRDRDHVSVRLLRRPQDEVIVTVNQDLGPEDEGGEFEVGLYPGGFKLFEQTAESLAGSAGLVQIVREMLGDPR